MREKHKYLKKDLQKEGRTERNIQIPKETNKRETEI
jgi:hypothetical protein